MASNNNNKHEYLVRCHCGQVRGRFKCDKDNIIAWDCNCSDCFMRRNVHIIVPEDDFRLDMMVPPVVGGGVPSDDSTTTTTDQNQQELLLQEASILYEWGTKTAKRPFCRTCGIMPWYRPRSNPDGYGITLYCVDWGGDDNNNNKPKVEIRQYDGEHWEDSHKSTGIGELSKKTVE